MASQRSRPRRGQHNDGRRKGDCDSLQMLCSISPEDLLSNSQAKDETFLEHRVKKRTNHQVGFGEAIPPPVLNKIPATYKGRHTFTMHLIGRGLSYRVEIADTTPYFIFQ